MSAPLCRPLGGFIIAQGDATVQQLDVEGCRYVQSTADGTLYFCNDRGDRLFWFSLLTGIIYDFHDLGTARFAPDPGKLGVVRLIWSGASGTTLNIW